MKQLIVNADDFGLTLGVANGIVKAHRDGVVTSTTILINTPHLEKVLQLLKEVDSLDLGLHLNVTWGTPVSEPSQVKTLIGDDGRFIRRTDFEGVDLEEVRVEWEAQIAKARSLAIKLTHLDTHHHTHRNPGFLDIIAELAESESLAVRAQEAWIRDFLRANKIRTTDHFIEDFYGEGKTSLEHLENLLRFIPDGTIEVCCHPAFVDDELRKTSSYNEPRAEELKTLTDEKLREWLTQNGFTLTNFLSVGTPSSPADKSCGLRLERKDPL